MIEKIRFIIPNLNRRPDRWKYCRDSLLACEVPEDNIVRFPAFDGLKYLDREKNHRNLIGIKRAITNYFGGDLPVFLKNDRLLTNYAWNCTWYAGLNAMCKLPETELSCWLIDDFVIDVSYRDLLRYAQILEALMRRQWRTLFAIQLARYPQVDNFNGMPVAECPVFQYGFGSRDDGAMIFSPRGAKWFVNYTNRISKHRYQDSLRVVAAIQHSQAKNGFFGIPPQGENAGLARLCDKGELKRSLIDVRFTDHGMSSRVIEKETEASGK